MKGRCFNIKFFDLFSGIGGFRFALERAGHECVGHSEIDEHAVKSYRQIFDTEGEWFKENAREINPEQMPDFDILCAGFPCQAFSVAGKRGGFEDTRGTLFFEIARISRAKLPSLLFLENVRGLLSHSNGQTFVKILKTLDDIGYDVEWQVLNSKHFGVPQNRERVFIVGHLRGRSTRKVFPLQRKDREITEEPRAKFVNQPQYGRYKLSDTADTLTSIGKSSRQKIIQIGNYRAKETGRTNPQTGRVYSPDGISPTLNSMQGGDRQPKIIEQEGLNTTQDDNSFCIDSNYFKGLAPSDIDNGRRTQIKVKQKTEVIGNTVPSGHSAGNVYNPDGLEPTVRENHGKITKTVVEKQTEEGEKVEFRVRKLTPKECWRLQGFPDWAFEKAAEVNSDTQLYRQAGNAVTVPVVEAIAHQLDNPDNEKWEVKTDEEE